ncbi:hypothetical protein PRIPAC_85672 [Pristionchus pacificus]|uniref:Uncharacterized protein n=1 Tax=Pristionchus pacificus TaxID=54126 RepID=A0A2A6BMM2_PRIPA|nr:hypothetical protein PRIPAC_85672 [Pristionchus pacificus]|eukprot:PDM67149.1 hypothetical protein PRIPAC_48566 [Pristionchus pacificus]
MFLSATQFAYIIHTCSVFLAHLPPLSDQVRVEAVEVDKILEIELPKVTVDVRQYFVTIWLCGTKEEDRSSASAADAAAAAAAAAKVLDIRRAITGYGIVRELPPSIPPNLFQPFNNGRFARPEPL